MGIDGLQKPFFAQVGDYPLYIAPPGSPNSGFGDLSFRPPSSGIGGFMEYHIRVKGSQPDGQHAAYWRWWTEQLGNEGRRRHPGLPLCRQPAAAAGRQAADDLPPSKVFRGIGVASLHTTLLDSRDDVHFLFKSSPFGTQSHGHNPHNTFQLNAYGEALLTTCVYRDLHGSKFHYQWAHSTVAHNGVLVDGEGQIKHTPAPHGRIVDCRFTPEWDYVVGDATEAYGGRLTRYQRHVVFVKGSATEPGPCPYLVLYDDLEAKSPATFQFMLHALRAVRRGRGQAATGRPAAQAGVDVQYLSPLPLAFRQWDGFTPPPNKEFPNQWHVEAGTREPSQRLGMLTVLVPYRAGQRPAWTAERVETNDGLAVRFACGGQVQTIAFPPPGRGGSVRVELGR